VNITESMEKEVTGLEKQKKDEWSSFADFIAELIEKYATVLDVDNMPDPQCRVDENGKQSLDYNYFTETIEI
jgi:hypothetical protein